tara:strand:- start:475 stop:732 length:258 start_codon:yes stop_codon:yes gene_type:complete
MLGPIERKFFNVVKQKPAVAKTAPVSNGGVDVGEGNETRETNDFSEKKKAEASTHAFTYGSKGQLYNADGQEIKPDDVPKLDEPS